MFARFGKCAVIAALVFSTGLHWAALQTIAWTTMLADNLQGASFSAAVTRTFDGQHLCPICKAIAAAKNAEQKNSLARLTLKLEFPPAAKNFTLIAPAGFELLPPQNFSAEFFSAAPPLPPPRGCFA